jgi:streptogramin lyase
MIAACPIVLSPIRERPTKQNAISNSAWVRTVTSTVLLRLATAAVVASLAVTAHAQVVTQYTAGISSSTRFITKGPDGNLWFTEDDGISGEKTAIGRITPAGVVTEFSAGITQDAHPGAITAGPDGNLWFAEAAGVGRITPQGVITEFTVGFSVNPAVRGITAGPDGNIWFTEGGTSRIGSITPDGQVTELADIGYGTNLGEMITDPGGVIWFGMNNDVGKITPDGTIYIASQGPLFPDDGSPGALTVGPDGNIWFTEDQPNIGMITPAGVAKEFPTGVSPYLYHLGGIATGNDGNLWFQVVDGRMGRMTTAGQITFFNTGVPANVTPYRMTLGPDGAFWFTELNGHAIVRFMPSSTVTVQIVTFGAPSNVGIGQSETLNATASSGLPVTFTSQTPLTCSISGSTVNGLSGGSCTIVATQAGNNSYPPAQATQTFNITGGIIPQAGYWWDPAEGGNGFVLEMQANTYAKPGDLFMAVFDYDVSGRATWYSAGVTHGQTEDSEWLNTTSTYANGTTLTGTYQPATFSAYAGDLTIYFTSPTQATVSWYGAVKQIQRFDFGPGGSQAAQPAGTPQTGWWWAPTEPGRGYAIEVQGGTMFLSGYMYDAQGNPIWYASGPAPMTNAMLYQGTWQQFGNGETYNGSYKAPALANPDVGNVTVQFTSATAGTLTFPNGRQVAIQRYAF